MIVHDCEQGTAEWLRARAGIPTSSMFDKIVTKSGALSSSAKKYMYRLIAERLMGRPLDEHVSMWMQRGKDLEAEAVFYYEAQRNLDTKRVGFLTNDEGTIGASPDRLVGDEGLAEIKVPAPHTHVMYLLGGAVGDEYRPQAQGQLWITERKWVDVCSYHPEMPKTIVRVPRDELFIRKLSEGVRDFSRELEGLWKFCEAKNWAPDESRQAVLDSLSRNLRTPFRGPSPETDELVFE